MLGRKYSCYGCKKRTITCHSTCPEYLVEKAENDRNNERYKQSKQMDYARLETIKRLTKINKQKCKTPKFCK